MNIQDQMNQAIELKREEMHQASDRYGLSSLMVLQKSRELDMLLNHYEKNCGCKRKRAT
ncbi:aspartyl-phosphate phosphatase Spo0E family protein [Paenibacillus glycanilyticus]|uniref:Spo0E family sporulation regulatory protein-aspartic acid phosphatase n=1 Tax=Paenibacillus glycanilyticus TaxID=126569 RepID=UPI00203FB92A|nr:aspartyl-phosphate phosphatase Spo0E family protein [Paenibacillus glycanilyticus]MCM3627020.1 aspartyl-phosphate phosphatase Spo0E family protein [Paenibacillus glycanilyticus]